MPSAAAATADKSGKKIAAAANAAAEPPSPETPLEPHQRLEVVAARLAASVGDASELVTAARMLQNDGEDFFSFQKVNGKKGAPSFFVSFSDLFFPPLFLSICKKQQKNHRWRPGISAEAALPGAQTDRDAASERARRGEEKER